MREHLSTRPLILAGAASVLGVALSDARALTAAAPLLLSLAGWAVARRRHETLLFGAALGAGLVAGARSDLARTRSLEALESFRARGPPSPAVVELTVERADEEPFAHRAWLVGRREDGVGVLCSWSGRCPDGVEPGARVRVAGRAYVPCRPGNPGQRDPRAALARHDASCVVDARCAGNVEVRERG
ncbi:MAG: DUF4131 domain-containing protein, partial [Planctomycetota bacterium]